MKPKKDKIAFSGGCYWCLEAVFQSLRGVDSVEQGFIAPDAEPNEFSEAVIVHYNPARIALKTLIEIHLHTHKSTVNHSMRSKYRSAVYVFSNRYLPEVNEILKELQIQFDEKLITKAYLFNAFEPSEAMFKNYYYTNPHKPFCLNYINPKLQLLIQKFKGTVNLEQLDASSL
ncbi:peptide-methionine (S)-S-oxide reductase [Zhouia amylolytica]|uniref:peptide-methionine (S)-S-oxide reductase n=1 Tax=Zhouia amylolytica AD3 TaxID=1286632 RepID=W2ULD4_9FLAO|nr:peptide-methionine (S)-S-oxide reductase [Zhouia amylolytica]ETN94769.1 peptide methionine sulfoxide reductase [Zhouia amylolytica AD3]